MLLGILHVMLLGMLLGMLQGMLFGMLLAMLQGMLVGLLLGMLLGRKPCIPALCIVHAFIPSEPGKAIYWQKPKTGAPHESHVICALPP
jgi:predicted lipid-binding transport protein (Tim44 family)